MYNWSTDERRLRRNKKQHTVWKLEQMVNFGLNGKKIKELDLREHWNQLSIDPARKKFLSILLHEKHPHRAPGRGAKNRRQR